MKREHLFGTCPTFLTGHASGLGPVDQTYDIAYARNTMKTITATEARANLYRLLDEVAESNEPIQITGRRHNAVLLSEEDWRALEETLHLVSIPGMRDSIREGMEAPVDECSEDPEW